MTASSRYRVGVIVDRLMLAKWQADALRTLAGDAELLVYNCRNTRPLSRHSKFAIYYLLNLLSVRNRMTRRQPWPAELRVAGSCEFDAHHEGAWQRLPAHLIEQIRADRVDAIVKFGMGLLRIPTHDQLPVPILSYHHGDPAEFRGRPAGFYEMLSGKYVMGQVVQRISNNLDAGEIVAVAETKVFPHSYRSTLIEAYRHSPLLLKRAVENALIGGGDKLDNWGRNYRLPTNGQVLRFLIKQCREAMSRLGYGMFKEKRWKVATVPVPQSMTMRSLLQMVSSIPDWQSIPAPKGFRFLADPFFHPADGLLVEGMNVNSCRGEILHVGQQRVRRLSGRGGHYSYPAHVHDGEGSYIVPEVSDWSSAQAFPLGDGGLGEPFELRIAGCPALLDPTPFRDGDTLFLFANKAEEGASILRLWVANDLHGDFVEHPASPIRLSPDGSRMAGSLHSIGGELYRVGQDLRGRYGDGITFFKITRIDRDGYCEVAEQHLRFSHVRGPHTLNIDRNRAAFDYYIDRFNLFAGIRRLMENRAARRVR